MHLFIFPVGFILWYFAYEAKPSVNDDATLNWREINADRRSRLTNIINESLYS
tara:strand:+ start:376 stop:534 length:159 start_codon:yes stop_codon:yes gene_type:complete